MRRQVAAGNWKMNMTASQAKTLVAELIPLVKPYVNCDIIVCPPAIDIPAVAETIKGTNIKLGAQNVHWEQKGAYTGEISADMLREFGVEYAIIGHSERRGYFGETDEGVNKRARAALAAGITPIICVGESLAQREAGETDGFVAGQVRAALAGISGSQARTIIIAYEPIWAIGTGKTATCEEANATIKLIRETVADLYGDDTAAMVRILYGGSMNDANAYDLIGMEHIDGGLIGGAALKADKFAVICKAAN